MRRIELSGGWEAPALIECLVNAEQVRACMEVPGQRFRAGNDAEALAATELQAGVRGCLARREAAVLRVRHAAATKITRRAKVKLAQAWAAREVVKLRQRQKEQWEELTRSFAADWPKTRDAPLKFANVVVVIAEWKRRWRNRRMMCPSRELHKSGF